MELAQQAEAVDRIITQLTAARILYSDYFAQILGPVVKASDGSTEKASLLATIDQEQCRLMLGALAYWKQLQEPGGVPATETEVETLRRRLKTAGDDLDGLRHSFAAVVKERDAAESRLREIEAGGEPVAWMARLGSENRVFSTEAEAANWFHKIPPVPLYEAPPPAAIGVEGERFAVLYEEGTECAWFRDPKPKGPGVTKFCSREEADRLAATPYMKSFEVNVPMPGKCSVVRVVPADAPTVDVAAIRHILDGVGDYARPESLVAQIRTAIGEKGGK